MRQWLKKYDMVARGIALLAAIIVWVYVMETDNPKREVEYRNIPVAIQGVNDIFNAYNLSVISGLDSTVRVEVVGKNDQISRLARSQITATADLSHINAPGTYTIPYEVSLPNDQVSVSNKTPSAIEVVVDKVVTQSVPVQVVVNGEAPANYVYLTPRLGAQTVILTGPSTHLEQVSHAQITLQADGWEESKTVIANYELIDQQGEVFSSPYITKESTTVRVTLPVNRIDTVPLRVTLVDGGDITADMVTVTLDPAEIRIMGTASVLNQITQINAGEIDLTNAKEGDVVELTVTLPEGTTLAEGQNNKVKATLQVDGWEATQVSVNVFDVQDRAVGSGKSVHVTTTALHIMLRARGSVVESLQPSDFTVTVPVDSSYLQTGIHTVPVQVTAKDASRVQVVGTYSVTVEVT